MKHQEDISKANRLTKYVKSLDIHSVVFVFITYLFLPVFGTVLIKGGYSSDFDLLFRFRDLGRKFVAEGTW